MKTFILSLLLLTSFSISYSQNLFEKGSITQSNGNTIEGFLKIISNKSVAYKATIDSNILYYEAKTIEGFSIYAPFEKYVSKSLNNTKDKLFFKYIIEGNTSLMYSDNNYYIDNQENGLNLLEVKKTIQNNKTGVYESKINTYVGVLNYYAKDCQTLQKKANSTKYNRKSLANFVLKLNACQNSESKDYLKSSRIDLLEIGVTTGSNFASFENTVGNPYKTKTSGSLFGLNLGAFVAFSPDIKKYNVTFEFGVEYNQKRTDYTYKEQNFTFDRTAKIDAAVIESYAAIIYQPFYSSKTLFNPYLGAGTSYGFNLKHDINVSNGPTTNSSKLDTNQNFSLMLKLGTFINVKDQKFMFELSYSDYNYKYSGFIENYGNNLQVKVGYVFNIK